MPKACPYVIKLAEGIILAEEVKHVEGVSTRYKNRVLYIIRPSFINMSVSSIERRDMPSACVNVMAADM